MSCTGANESEDARCGCKVPCVHHVPELEQYSLRPGFQEHELKAHFKVMWNLNMLNIFRPVWQPCPLCSWRVV